MRLPKILDDWLFGRARERQLRQQTQVQQQRAEQQAAIQQDFDSGMRLLDGSGRRQERLQRFFRSEEPLTAEIASEVLDETAALLSRYFDGYDDRRHPDENYAVRANVDRARRALAANSVRYYFDEIGLTPEALMRTQDRSDPQRFRAVSGIAREAMKRMSQGPADARRVDVRDAFIALAYAATRASQPQNLNYQASRIDRALDRAGVRSVGSYVSSRFNNFRAKQRREDWTRAGGPTVSPHEVFFYDWARLQPDHRRGGDVQQLQFMTIENVARLSPEQLLRLAAFLEQDGRRQTGAWLRELWPVAEVAGMDPRDFQASVTEFFEPSGQGLAPQGSEPSQGGR